MARIFFVRHGESEANLQYVFAGGKTDTPLTDLGREQARQAGRELKSHKINRIIASPLNRTRETAEIIAEEVGIDKNRIKFDPRFREYDVGAGAGLSQKGMTSAQLVALPGADDPYKFATRIKQALLDLAQEEGAILVVSHGGVGRFIECLRTNRDPAEFYDLPGYPNAHAVQLDLSWLD